MSNENALAKASPPSQALALKPARSLEDLAENFREAAKHGHLLSPMIAVDQVPAFHQVSIRAVVVDPTIPSKGNDDAIGTGPECYRDPRFCQRDEVALGKNALLKIMSAAGIQVVEQRRMDDRRDPYYCEIQVRLVWVDMDGLQQQRVAAKELDLRDGSPATMQPEKGSDGKKTGKMIPMLSTALADKRRHIASLCETEAILRGVRSILHLASKYKVSDLDKPFYVPKLVPFLDTADPQQRALALRRVEASQGALYGPRPTQAQPAEHTGAAVLDVDPETGEVLQNPPPTVDDITAAGFPPPKAAAAVSAEPWEKDPPKLPARRFMLTGAELQSCGERRDWFARLNELAQAVFDKFGEDLGAEKLAECYPETWDPATSPATMAAVDVKRVGEALKARVYP